MIYLPYDMVEKAKLQSVTMSQYVAVVRLFGVCGIEKKWVYDMVRNYLISHRIPHCCNDRGMVWLPQLENSIQEILSTETVTITTN